MQEILSEEQKRLELWSSKPGQICHLAMGVLVELHKNKTVLFKNTWLKILDMALCATNPKGTMASLATNAGKNYGKVTYFDANRVKLVYPEYTCSLNWQVDENLMNTVYSIINDNSIDLYTDLSIEQIAIIKELFKALENNELRVEYGELSKRIKDNQGIDLHPRTQIPKLTEDIDRLCVEFDTPILSVMVVNKETQKPGPGFYTFMRKICQYKGDDNYILKKVKEELINFSEDNWEPMKHYLRLDVQENYNSLMINNLDVPAPIPTINLNQNEHYQTNPELKLIAIKNANYCCLNNQNHKTFISNKTGENYVEGHHLIPMKYQKNFNYSVDVLANIVPLCPNCHKLLHLGLIEDKKEILEKLYNERIERLKQAGLDISFEKLISFYTNTCED